MPLSPELFEKITQAAKETVEEYYHQFPERFVPERSDDELQWIMDGLEKIRTILHDYKITKREPEP